MATGGAVPVIDISDFDEDDDSRWQMRAGVMLERPVVGLVSPTRAILVDAAAGTILASVSGTQALAPLDIAIEGDGAWLLQRSGSNLEVVRLAGEAEPVFTTIAKGSAGQVEFPCALRVIDGQPHVLANAGTDVTFIGPSDAVACLGDCMDRLMGVAGLD